MKVLKMCTKKILWIEDKDEKDIHESLILWCKKFQIDLIKVNDIGQLAEELEALKEQQEKFSIAGFIVDLLLSGTNNLSDFGIDYQWDHLQEDGGLILIQKVLRSDKFNYENTPILVLSVRANKIPELEKYHNLKIIQKRDYLNSNWEGEIKEWLKEKNN